jgi:hypothetical protein
MQLVLLVLLSLTLLLLPCAASVAASSNALELHASNEKFVSELVWASSSSHGAALACLQAIGYAACMQCMLLARPLQRCGPQ